MREFLEVQEELNLLIMEIVRQAGTGFAFPSQTMYLARDTGA
jgi:MscS family membrane protein